MRKLVIDFETRSAANLKKVGAYIYATHPSTEVMAVAFAFAGEGKKPTILTGAEVQSPACVLREYAADPDIRLVAHSAFFEYLITNHILAPRYGYPYRWEPSGWGCTLSRAAMCGLPLALDKCGAALGLKARKDPFGKAAMLRLSKPREIDPLGDPEYLEDPELYAKMLAYCGLDVESELELDERLPELPPIERKVWELDLLVNYRGVKLDVDAAKKAMLMAKGISGELNTRLTEITGDFVSAASQVGEMKHYLLTQGIAVESLNKQAVTDLLSDKSLPEKVREVLSIRRQVGKSSTAKYGKILDVAAPIDHRARGLLQYHGAATGRFAGRGLQIHNLPKGVKADVQKKIIAAILSGDPWMFSLIYGDKAMEMLSNALRGMIISAVGKELVVADFTAIEARVVLWLAGDVAALDEIRRGVSSYLSMGKYLFGKDITKDDNPYEYAISKATILGAGFGMGAVRFVGNCAQNGLLVSDEMALKAIRGYRTKHKAVVDSWYANERAAANAIRTPGTIHRSCGGKVVWGMDKKREFLVCKLPSGRHLRYFKPSLVSVDTPRGEKEQIRYFTVGKDGALMQTSTYGGELTENVTQAVARDLLVNGMLNVEAAGYPVIATVHDEIISEVDSGELDSGEKSLEKFIAIMCSLPDWGKDIPVAAEGFTGRRYRK